MCLIKAPKYMKQKLIEMKGEMDNDDHWRHQ